MLTRLILLAIIVIIAIAIKRQLAQSKGQDSHSSAKSHNKKSLSRKEALYILGLEDPTSQEQVLQAYKRLINKVHPDKGGTDFFASQLNLAKEVVLKTQTQTNTSNATDSTDDKQPKE